MKRGMRVGLSRGHTVLNGDAAPFPQRGTAPQFSAHTCCGQMAGWIKMPLGMEVDLGPGDFVLDEDHPPPAKNRGRGTSRPNFQPMCNCIVAKRLDLILKC